MWSPAISQFMSPLLIICASSHFLFCSTCTWISSMVHDIFAHGALYLHYFSSECRPSFLESFCGSLNLAWFRCSSFVSPWNPMHTPHACVCVYEYVCYTSLFLCQTPTWIECYHIVALALPSLRKNNLFLVDSNKIFLKFIFGLTWVYAQL